MQLYLILSKVFFNVFKVTGRKNMVYFKTTFFTCVTCSFVYQGRSLKTIFKKKKFLWDLQTLVMHVLIRFFVRCAYDLFLTWLIPILHHAIKILATINCEYFRTDIAFIVTLIITGNQNFNIDFECANYSYLFTTQ